MTTPTSSRPKQSQQDAQTREAHKVTLVGAAVDFVVGLMKLVTGFMVGSAALVADGIHSFSDILTDIFVVLATHFGRRKPDEEHPYGHGRIETLATLWLGGVLIFAAGGIAWAGLSRLLEGHVLLAPGFWAIGVAVLALLAKEWIYHYTMRTARRINSRLLEANAWHSRSDALSTVVVLIGLVASQFGAGWMDAVAAVVVAALVGQIGGRLLWTSSRELIDTALPEAQQHSMQENAQDVPGVLGIHDLRARALGSDVVLDLHIVVSPRLTVSEAHEIGNAVSRKLRKTFPEISDVTFHIDPEDDAESTRHSRRPGMPLRDEVENMLDTVWHDLDAWRFRSAMDLHYLDNRVDIAIYVPSLPDTQDPQNAATELRRACTELSWVGNLQVWEGPGSS